MVKQVNLWMRAVLFGGLICAGVFLFAGNQSSTFARFQRSEELSAYFFWIEITNRVYTTSLEDPSSNYFQILKAEVEQLMNDVYNCSTCSSTNEVYDGAYDMSFQKGLLPGSVIAKMTLVFKTVGINQHVVKFIFLGSMLNNPSEILEINADYTADQQTPIPAVITPAPATTPMTTPTHITTGKPITSQKPTSESSTGPDTTTSAISVTNASITVNPNNRSTTGAGWTSPHSNTGRTESNNPMNSTSTLHPAMPTTNPSSGGGVGSKTTPESGNQGKSTPSTTFTTTTTRTPSSGRERPYWLDWVPGWGIALLVLTALILLLVIILLILLLIRMCRKRGKKQPLPMPEQSQQATPTAPSYVSHSPAPAPKDMDDDHPDKPKRNKTGLYVVNP